MRTGTSRLVRQAPWSHRTGLVTAWRKRSRRAGGVSDGLLRHDDQTDEVVIAPCHPLSCHATMLLTGRLRIDRALRIAPLIGGCGGCRSGISGHRCCRRGTARLAAGGRTGGRGCVAYRGWCRAVRAMSLAPGAAAGQRQDGKQGGPTSQPGSAHRSSPYDSEHTPDRDRSRARSEEGNRIARGTGKGQGQIVVAARFQRAGEAAR
jgi:hypothetical protein